MSNIQIVNDQLTKAKKFAHIFGQLRGLKSEQIESLNEQYRHLVKIVHPDKAKDSEKLLATKVFELLTEMKNRALEAIENNNYDNDIGISKKVVIESKIGKYSLDEKPITTGEFSQVYIGSNGTFDVLAKISDDPTNNHWLLKEVDVVKKFSGSKVEKYVQLPIDTFTIEMAGKRYQTLIYKLNKNLVSVEQVAKSKQDIEDLGWIARRIASQAIAASTIGLVHCSITPDHVLIDRINREPIHIGWTHSIKPKNSISMVVDKWNDIYPSYVFKKKPVSCKTDLYMAGMTIMYLFGGDIKTKSWPSSVPSIIKSILNKFIDEEYDCPIRAVDELTAAIRHAWGRKYKELVI